MKIQTLVRTDAEMVRVTQIGKGAVYKRLDTPSYGNSTTLVFGVVIDVLSNGEKAAVIAVEFTPVGYGGNTEASMRTFSGSEDVSLYPADPDEFRMAMEKAIDGQKRGVERHTRELEQKVKVLEMMQSVISGTLELESARTEVVPVAEEESAEDVQP